MNKLRSFLAVCALVALSCNALDNLNVTPETNIDPATGCPNPQPTDAEVDQARQYQEQVFTSADWTTSYTVMDNRITVTYKNSALNSVINFDTVTFCGVTDAGLDDYYTDATFKIIFQYYDAYEFTTDCRSSDLRLYELKFKDEGIDYQGRYWVEILDADHIRETLAVFPVSDPASLDTFSNKLMPDMPSCN